jgi:hypothetical protein
MSDLPLGDKPGRISPKRDLNENTSPGSVLALILVSAAAAKSPPPPPPPPPPHYVVLGAQGPVARAIMIPDKNNKVPHCPRIEVDGTSKKMAVRAKPKGKHFNIRVCEFVLGSAKSATIGGQTLPLPLDELKSISVFGDTGCRIKVTKAKKAAAKDVADDDDDDEGQGEGEEKTTGKGNGKTKEKVQDCKDTDKWPFAPMSATIAKAKPDLVIHVGDYLYRESKCPDDRKKDCEKSPHGDNWDTWAADFFTPAAPLLQAAPWIVTRGNHEICTRAGLGYALLLDPTPANGDRPKCGRKDPPLDQYTVKVGGRAFIMLDSSDAADDCKKSGCKSDWYEKQFEAMKPAPGSWLITHKPIWGFTNSKGKLGIRNFTLQDALKKSKGVPPAGIELVLSGHIHLWEALSFADGRTPQFVLGSGSTKLSHEITEDLQGQEVGGTTVAAAKTDHRFGYTMFAPTQAAGHWDATYHPVDSNAPTPIACKVKPGEVDCK